MPAGAAVLAPQLKFTVIWLIARYLPEHKAAEQAAETCQ